MNNPDIKTRFIPSPAAVLAVAAVYAVVAKLSFLLTISPGNISPIFPAAGVALAAVIIMGRNALIGVWLGSFVANGLSFFDGSVSSGQALLPALLVASVIGLGAMSGAGVGAFLVRRFCQGEHPLQGGRNVLILVTVGALGGCMISPTFGVLSLALTGNVPWERFGYSWVTWWVGDAAGTLVAAPLMLAWQQRHPFPRSAGRILEAAVLGGTTVLLCFFVFFGNTPFEYGLLPLLLWAAFHFGMRGVSITSAVIALFAMIGTSRGTSPFVGATVNESLLLLNSFFGVTITCALFMAGMMEERRRAAAALFESEQKYRELVEHANSIILRWARDGRVLFLNEFGQKFFGYSAEEILGRHVVGTIVPEAESTHRNLRELMDRITADPKAFEQNTNENMRRNGERVWIAWTNRTVLDKQGRVSEVLSIGHDITERKVHEQEMRQSEEQFRLIMESLTDLVAVLDLNGRRLYNSPAYGSILGEPEALVGTSSFDQVHPEDRERVRQAFQETVRTGVGQRLEYRIVGQSGQACHIESQGSVIRDDEGRVSKVVMVSRDVTERRKVAEILQESESRYRFLFEHNPIPMLIYERGTLQMLAVNEAFIRHYGYSREESVALRLTDLYPEEQRAGIAELAARLHGHANVGEWRHRKRDGTFITVVTSSHDLVYQGKSARVAVTTDITERKRAEESLRQSEATLRSVFKAAPVGICIVKNRLIQTANAIWYEIIGYTEAEIHGQPLRMLYQTEQEFQRVGREMYTDLRKRGLTSVKTRYLCHGGALRDVILTAAPLNPNDPCNSDAVVVVHDVTERQRAEDELRATQASLERRVLVRTTELAEARDRAEAADRLKSAFLATMSHELRTPLNSIIGFTGIMLQGLAGPLNEEQTKQLRMVQNSARHLLALINDVLDISKIEAGQVEIHAEPFDLRTSLEKVAGLVRPLAEKKGLALQVQLPPAAPPVVSDRRRVEQVLLNLLNNAIKFTERGHVALTVETIPNPQSTIRISVADTGIGIKPEDLAKLFLPFRQIDTGLTRQYEGTGLGLAICRRLAGLLGGEISVRSDWGKGSTFSFTLPMEGGINT